MASIKVKKTDLTTQDCQIAIYSHLISDKNSYVSADEMCTKLQGDGIDMALPTVKQLLEDMASGGGLVQRSIKGYMASNLF